MSDRPTLYRSCPAVSLEAKGEISTMESNEATKPRTKSQTSLLNHLPRELFASGTQLEVITICKSHESGATRGRTRTANGALPVIIKLVFHKSQDQAGITGIRHVERDSSIKRIAHLDLPTADSPKGSSSVHSQDSLQ